jgi:hypothetical protein
MARFRGMSDESDRAGRIGDAGVTIETTGRNQVTITVQSEGRVQRFTVPRTPLVSRGDPTPRLAG